MPVVYLEKEEKTIKIDELSVKEILKKLKINPTTVIIAKNSELITEDAKLSKEDKISIIPVISGG